MGGLDKTDGRLASGRFGDPISRFVLVLVLVLDLGLASGFWRLGMLLAMRVG
jgi:hypothetical protein